MVLAHVCIDHSHIAHGFLLRKEEQPQCIPCGCPIAIKSIFIDYADFVFYSTMSSLHSLSEMVDPSKMFAFNKEIGLFNKF